MAKRRKKVKSNSNYLSYITWALSLIVVVSSSLAIGYYFGYDDGQKNITLNQQKKEKVSTKTQPKNINDRLKDILKQTPKNAIDASHEYEDLSLEKPPLRTKKESNTSSSKPKLAIIFDDVSVKSQVKAIKSLNLPLTMSFLPPSKSSPNSAKLASKEDFYMVHLPMQAMGNIKEEPFTLRIQDSQSEIDDRVQKIKKLFPKVRYVNNHTGSKFTSNEISVNKLISVLNIHNINFIDSRTTADTMVPKVMKNFGLKYVARDVFLDHNTDKAYIKKQIKKAIKIANAHGTAIAIGHPHTNTILAIRESKALFVDVELVLINKLY
ncbi:MAG: divergent polysaccharide deacetylase family protein [Sulfurimonas sp.]|nr:divergent polysaccharide deacetylase family protein [Sulfurimonas sp.]